MSRWIFTKIPVQLPEKKPRRYDYRLIGDNMCNHGRNDHKYYPPYDLPSDNQSDKRTPLAFFSIKCFPANSENFYTITTLAFQTFMSING